MTKTFVSFFLHSQIYRRITRMICLVGFSVLAGLSGACEKYVYFWDEHPNLPGDPKPQGKEKKATGPGGIITVSKGDTLYGLAQRHGLVLRDFIKVNHLKPPYILQPGQRLEAPQSRVYRVSKGDTAYGIARRHGVDVYRLIQLNNLSGNAVIREGQRLKLPPPVVLSPPAQSSKSQDSLSGQAAKEKKPIRQSGNRIQDIRNTGPTGSTEAQRPKPRPKNIQSKPPRPKAVSPPKLAGKGFSWPVRGRVILPYGKQAGGRFNDGINIAAQSGSDIRAAQNGVVVYVGNELPGFGNLLIVKHADGWTSAYAQCREIFVKRGQKVKKGQVVAEVGATGNVSKPQLHFELRRRAQPVDPRRYLI